MTHRLCFLTGPTASGKSSLALSLAEYWNAEIINCDSMQVYRDLAIITARPSPADEGRVPHHLYGHIDGAIAYDTAAFVKEAAAIAQTVLAAGRNVIFVGGTGLYFKALVDGLAAVPDIPKSIRDDVLGLANEGADVLYDALIKADPTMAARLNRRDRQRVGRALEVVKATGHSLSHYQERDHSGPLWSFDDQGLILKIRLMPEREALYARCNQRLDWMLEHGALAEIARLLDRGLSDRHPVMRALGVPQLKGFVRGDTDRETAVNEAAMQTRRFAKRQLTWIRNQFTAWYVIELKYNNKEMQNIFQYITENLLTGEY